MQFSSGDVTTFRSVTGANKLGNGSQLQAIRDYYKFQILYKNVIGQMNEILTSYADTTDKDLTYVTNLNYILATRVNEITVNINDTDLYDNRIVQSLYNFKYEPYLFSNYQYSISAMIKGMEIAIGNVKKNLELRNTNSELVVFKNILNGTDKTLIYDYIMQRNQDLLVFSASQIVDLDFEIKPWYAEYLTTYGPPPDGIFDIDNLSKIVINLINNQVITLNDFISDRSH
jgi:hypothetical protein